MADGVRSDGIRTENEQLQTDSEALSPYEVVDERIRQMESQYDLLQYEVDGWCCWPIVRYALQWLVAYDSRGLSVPRRFIQHLVWAIKDIPSLIVPRKVHYIVKTYTSGLVEQEGRFYKDVWFDDLIQELGPCFKIETINNPNFIPRRKAALVTSDLTSHAFHLVAGALAHGSGPSYIPEIASRMHACIKSEFRAEVFSSRWIVLRLRYFYWLKKLYSGLLKRVRPAYLLTAGAGEQPLIAAAKEQGIKVIELQHGFVDRHHSCYSWTDYAVKYKARMPIPDSFFLFGEHWKRELDTNGFWGETLRVVGSPQMDQYRRRKVGPRPAEICVLLLSTGSTTSKSTIIFISEFLKAAQGKLDLYLYIKLHPVSEWSKEPYLDVFHNDPRVEILLGSEAPSTLELLTRVHFHLSVCSTCHYDALGLGVPTVILPLASHEIVLPLYQAGHAFLAQNPHDLLTLLLRQKDHQISEEIGRYYFKSGALENMKNELS